MKKKAIHHIDVVERRTDALAGHRLCVLGENIRFDKSAIERSTFRPLDDVDIDLLVVISSVAYADRLIQRRRGTQWSRAISMRIPVHHPETWTQLSGKLSSLLRLLSGDAWSFEFCDRERPHPRQEYVPLLLRSFEGATVIPYSGGLDSFAVLARIRNEAPSDKVLLVNARPAGGSDVARPDDAATTIGVPFSFRGPRLREPSYRTRTFIYFALAALVWWKNSGQRILIGESGVGCLGPSLVPVGIEHPVRSSHPDFTHALSALLGQLWGTVPPFGFPHLWSTKAMVLAELRASGSAIEGWTTTRSCSRNVQRHHPCAVGTHCGLCTGCLFRQVSVHASGLGAESPGTYFVDVLRHASLPDGVSDADRDIGRCAVLTMDELAGIADRVEQRHADIAELAASLREPVEATRARLGGLIRTFRDEWHSFLEHVPDASWIHSLTFHGAS